MLQELPTLIRGHRAIDVGRGAVAEPGPVGLGIGVGEKTAEKLTGDFAPMMRFGMAIGKSEAATAVVITAGAILPEGLRHVERERGVVEADGIFVGEDPEH